MNNVNEDTIEKNNMKTKRILLLDTAIILLSLIFIFMSLNSTFGWLSKNRDLNGDGMSISVAGSPNVIISDTVSEVTNCTGNDNKDLTKKIFTADDDVELSPAMHDSTTHKLVVIDDEDNINPLTGKAKNYDTLNYTDAENNVHYIDFVTYIGVYGASVSYTTFNIHLDKDKCFAQCAKGSTVKASVDYYTKSGTTFTKATPAVGSNAESYYTHIFDGVYLTTCIDILYEDTYATTLHPSELQNGDVKYTLASSGTLTPSTPVKVTLRVYFDGSMEVPGDDSHKTILRAGNQMINQIFLGFEYTLDDGMS